MLDRYYSLCYNGSKIGRGCLIMKYMLDFDNEMRAEVKKVAAQERISMNDLIVKAVGLYLEKKGK